MPAVLLVALASLVTETSAFLLSATSSTRAAGRRPTPATRRRSPVAALSPNAWSTTNSGAKFVDERIGNGAALERLQVAAVHYDMTLLHKGDLVRTSRGGAPLLIAFGTDTKIWIWDELLSGMNVGGRRRVVVPLTAMSPTQAACFPPDESVRVDLDLVRICTEGPLSSLATLMPPGERRGTIGRGTLVLACAAACLWGGQADPPTAQNGLDTSVAIEALYKTR